MVHLQELSIITGLDYWNELLEWTTGYWNGLPEWTTGISYWNGLLEWTTEVMTFFALKIIFMAYNEIFLPVHALPRGFLTWPPASLATSCLF